MIIGELFGNFLSLIPWPETIHGDGPKYEPKLVMNPDELLSMVREGWLIGESYSGRRGAEILVLRRGDRTLEIEFPNRVWETIRWADLFSEDDITRECLASKVVPRRV